MDDVSGWWLEGLGFRLRVETGGWVPTACTFLTPCLQSILWLAVTGPVLQCYAATMVCFHHAYRWCLLSHLHLQPKTMNSSRYAGCQKTRTSVAIAALRCNMHACYSWLHLHTAWLMLHVPLLLVCRDSANWEDPWTFSAFCAYTFPGEYGRHWIEPDFTK
jgi:hypothetical protein